MTLLERLGGPDTIRAGIAAEFRALNRTPHPSRHERSAVRALTARLAELGLAPVRDGHGNVMADVPAAPGRTAARGWRPRWPRRASGRPPGSSCRGICTW